MGLSKTIPRSPAVVRAEGLLKTSNSASVLVFLNDNGSASKFGVFEIAPRMLSEN